MLHLRFSLAPLAAALLLAGCQRASVTPDTATPQPLTTAERQTVSSANDFAYRAFGSLHRADPTENLCFSPLSVSAALTMAYNGADGSTKAAMKQTLGFQPLTDQQINESYQSLFARFTGLDNKVTFAAANSLWHGRQYQLQGPFVQANQTYFGASVQPVTFGDPAAAATINAWCSAKTQGRIPKILDNTTSDDVLYLLNAIYFKGAWTAPFDPRSTYNGQFRHENGSFGTADFMRLQRVGYRQYQDSQVQLVDLPYGKGNFSMTLLMPADTSRLGQLAARLSAPQLATWLAAADSTHIDLHLPKFKLEYEKELKPMLAQLGMGVAFGNSANFSRMVDGISQGLVITKVKHKAFLEVNEEGTEAAAVTSVGFGVTSVPPSIRFDRPFIFLIRERESGTILFMGKLMQP